MDLGLISDVHGNLPALERVLEEMPAVDRLVCLGDVVGYNPYPRECLERVRESCDLVLQGNHDRMVESPEPYRRNEMAYRGLEYAAEQLTDEQRRYLQELPESVDLPWADYLAVHSHPERTDAYVRPHQFPEMRPYLDEYRGLFLGHTHVQHEATVDGRLILNPGSVGQPRDDDPRAAFAVVDTDAGAVDVHRVEYDVGRVQRAVEEAGLPQRTADRLGDGH